MIYPNSFEEKIGFTALKELLKRYCISEMGRTKVDKISYHTDEKEIQKLLIETDEFLSVLRYEDPFPAQDFFDLTDVLKKIIIPGTFIEVEELAQLRSVIQNIIQIVVYFKIRAEEEKFLHLWDICKDIILEKELLSSINLILNSKGEFRDDASDELVKIKSNIRKISGEADRKIKKLLLLTKKEGIVKEDAEITIRNGRLCIPVPSAYKRRLQGFIHDESATGQTVFIEPTEVFDANNELRDLLNAEKREIIRILTQITDKIRFSIPNLFVGQEFLGTIDFIRAKAKLAILTHSVKPNILSYPLLNWRNAVHPLLFLNFKEVGKKVIPLHIFLSDKKRILIISGPNAGGKSVCLKTIGLLQYMMQCGLLVPMEPTSDMGIFSDFFIDIGDEQSIDNDLSTYSSHLTNLKTMLDHLQPSSLFLIDEFGSGTEPTLGGALAESILEAIYHKKSYGIITTHYGNLKKFPDTFEEAENGAMLYDTTEMKPLFILKIGKPGSSFTYEIAQLIGLSKKIIDDAISKTGTAQIDYERKLEEIENEKIAIDTHLKLVNAADEQLAQLISDYQLKFKELEKERKEILQKAKNQAVSIIESANKIIEKTIRDIKETQADNVVTKEKRKEINELKKEIQKEISPIEKESALKKLIPRKQKKVQLHPSNSPKPKIAMSLKVGDWGYIPAIQTVGEIKEIDGNKVVVCFNSIFYRTTIDKIEKVSKQGKKNISPKHVSKWDDNSLSDMMNKKVAHFKNMIDLRGKRVEEARTELSLYIDEAILLNIHEVRILHGKGNGILRRVVREYLSTIREVCSFADEQLEWGGDGITVVNLSY